MQQSFPRRFVSGPDAIIKKPENTFVSGPDDVSCPDGLHRVRELVVERNGDARSTLE